VRDVKALTLHLLQPAAHAVLVDAPSRSYFGGDPRLPPSVAWPIWNEKKLGFLARLSLAEISRVHSVSWLPNTGALLFFYDADAQPWGFDPKDRGCCAVLHVPDITSVNDSPESEIVKGAGLQHKNIAFCKVVTFPGWERDAIQLLNFTDGEFDRYLEVAGDPFHGMSRHQIAGYPAAVQADSMELECQLVSNGLYCGDGTGYADPRAEELNPGSSDWRLLFQIDSDDDLDIMWGDCGTIYFWIREQDARVGNFTNPWLIFQCA